MIRSVKAVCWGFARRLKGKGLPVSQTPANPSELEQLQENFAPLESLKPQPEPTNKLLKEIQKELVYAGEDTQPERLVKRIQKGAMWGLGGQLVQFSKKLNHEGVGGTVQQVKQYLLQQQTKDLYVHDFGPVMPHIRRWAIIATAYSNRHCYKVAVDLKNAFNATRTQKQYPAMMVGRKDDQWALVEFTDITVHVMTESQRHQSALEYKWNNPPSDQMVEKYQKMSKHKSRGMFEPMDD